MEPTTDNMLSSTSNDASALLEATRMIICVCLATSLLTMVINPFTVVAMALHGMLKKSATNLFIVSLCCADLITGTATFVLKLNEVRVARQPDLHSKFVAVLSWTAAGLTIIGYFSSLLTAFAIGLDRAVATIKPMKYRSWVTRKRGIVCLVAMWTLACIIVLTPLFMKLGSLDKEQPVPVIMHPPLAFPQEFIRYGSTPMIMCCLIGNALLYLAIVIAFNRVSHSTNSSASAKHSQRLTKTSVMVVSSLLICNTPITIMAALPPPTEPLQQLQANLIYNLLLIFLLVPTFSNNFLYAWHQRDFRRAYGRLLRCGRQNAAVRPNPPADNMTNSSTHAQTTE
ncbi:hypothetical protein CAPTEDRAFT_202108 [Capitella teleta]|uniref:G-protein coupled receptors family 1 profile domain-containing protein n=1 Tax=Capitella teleta TaxID=283909 RepID=R7U2Y2_CAPTE|nr:hypothetical protein CAPTEDRAFT_202108 [Capitella teleta]|eukprot:ELU00710.1 hypothetical protein CAPTEDRAFT_202108 [Capitella teleta]